MLTFEDCLGLSELTEEAILAIAEHERIPELAALEFGNYLMHAPRGQERIKRMILENIAAARKAGNDPRVVTLRLVLRRYRDEHRI